MKLYVAFLLVLTTVSAGAVQGQTAPRRGNQNAVSKPRTETIRICHGLPVPEGYVIIAYMTSSACPHGAYVLKKQDAYESSLAVNGSPRQPTDASSEPANTPANLSRSSTPPNGTSA